MKLQLRAKNLRSESLKGLSLALSSAMGYKVWRTTKTHYKRNQLAYGGLMDKISQYEWFKSKGLPCPEFTRDMDTAIGWIEDGHTVFCRTLTRASEGRGIVVATEVDHLVNAPVYTKYMKKKREFRVHIFRDSVVAVTEKRKRQGFNAELRDTKIRNLANGYVFCHELSAPMPEAWSTLAMEASKVTNSDFKGVDMIYNEKQDQLYVIEVNSAPGISGSNIGSYVQTILGY